MKLISWNVNGIRACVKKGFVDSMKKEDADIICLQETKTDKDNAELLLDGYPYMYWNFAEKKGYSGTAIFSKIKPHGVLYGIDKEHHDKEGRVITAEFDDFFLITVYTPNSKRELLRLDYRTKEWDHDFLAFVKKLEKKKPVIICGDLNVAHTEIDLAHPKSNYDKNPGYTQREIDSFEKILSAGYIDTFREFNKEGGQYTWWNQMFKARDRNVGWRIDYFLISSKLKSRLKDGFIRQQIFGSDHCPVGIVLK